MAKQTTKQRVKLRETPTAENRLTLYLDWSKDNKRKREYINLMVYEKAQTVLERHHNKEVYEKAELFRAEREKQFFSDEIDEIIEQKKIKNQDFYTFFETYLNNYTQKDKRVMQAVCRLFKEFAPPPLSTKQVDKNLCVEFKKFLESKLSGESPQSYFARFKKFLTYSSEEGKNRVFKQNPATGVKNTKLENSLKKDTLTIEELKALIGANCGNKDVKRAFLFACNTGLRFVDIKALKWKNIKDGKVEIDQAKTGINVAVELNENANQFLGVRGGEEESVFVLPSHNATVSNLDYWAKRAGIEKHVTFHVARHSFGTLLHYFGNDIETIRELMGHTSLKYTGRYVRVAGENKKKAVNSIPNF